MLINKSNLDVFFAGLKTVFSESFERAESHYQTLAMKVPSQAAEERYGWLGAFPRLREWLGDRIVHSLSVHGYTIRNRDFELTLSVSRNDIEDDRLGLFMPMAAEIGREAKQHPDELVFGLLAEGFSSHCYDGQYFFDTDHPVLDDAGNPQSVSNLQSGTGPAWFLMDLSKSLKPLIWQPRVSYEFEALTSGQDENVFWKNQFIYGVRARANAGFGLWQLIYASKEPLTAENYELARRAMSGLKGDYGRKLNIKTTHLVVGTALEGAARRLLVNGSRVGEDVGSGASIIVMSNEWQGSAELIVTPYLD